MVFIGIVIGDFLQFQRKTTIFRTIYQSILGVHPNSLHNWIVGVKLRVKIHQRVSPNEIRIIIKRFA